MINWLFKVYCIVSCRFSVYPKKNSIVKYTAYNTVNITYASNSWNLVVLLFLLISIDVRSQLVILIYAVILSINYSTS